MGARTQSGKALLFLPLSGSRILVYPDCGAAVDLHFGDSPIEGSREHVRDGAAGEGDTERVSGLIGVGYGLA